MKLNDIVADEKHGNGLLGLLIFLLVVGVTVGSVYLAKNSGDMAEGIKNYIGSFCTAVSENKNSMTVFKNSLQANLISVGIVFLMGFLRFDLYYKEGDEYPYWFYLSTSCGFGGRNSVISLIKAKSPGLWDDEYIDAGVVIASKENNNYNTNCIDANIFTDTDGKTYFIWGSFWKGIHIAELDLSLIHI